MSIYRETSAEIPSWDIMNYPISKQNIKNTNSVSLSGDWRGGEPGWIQHQHWRVRERPLHCDQLPQCNGSKELSCGLSGLRVCPHQTTEQQRPSDSGWENTAGALNNTLHLCRYISVALFFFFLNLSFSLCFILVFPLFLSVLFWETCESSLSIITEEEGKELPDQRCMSLHHGRWSRAEVANLS